MIEIQNAEQNSVFGTYFNCQTSPDLEFPPPKDFDAKLVKIKNNIKLRFTWKPFKIQPNLMKRTQRDFNNLKINFINGYVIYLKEKYNASSINKYFSEGLFLLIFYIFTIFLAE